MLAVRLLYVAIRLLLPVDFLNAVSRLGALYSYTKAISTNTSNTSRADPRLSGAFFPAALDVVVCVGRARAEDAGVEASKLAVLDKDTDPV